MEPGQLRQRITLRRVQIERSPQSGAERRIAQDVASLYCKAEMISNRKIRTADQQRGNHDTVAIYVAPAQGCGH
ncbi:hypothetical protein SODG_001805 [Sodalis praecaptivus]